MAIVCQSPVFADFSATPAEVSGRVDAHSGNIRGHVMNLRSQAESLAAEARGLIEQASNFSAGGGSGINFSAKGSRYSLVSPSLPPVPSLYKYDGGGLTSLGGAPTLNISDFSSSSITKPRADRVTFPNAPSAPGLSATPRSPNPGSVTIPDPPGVNITLSDLPNPGNAPAFSGFTYTPQFTTVQPLAIADVPLPDLSALERMQAAVEDKFQRNPYDFRVLENAMSAASALLNGNFIIDMDVLERGIVDNLDRATQLHERRLTRLWSKRGLQANPYARRYAENVASRFTESHQKAFDAALERWRMRLLPVALQLSVEAHSQMVEIMGDLYDMDFEFLEAEHAALQGLYGLAVARYNIEALRIDKAVAEYSGQSMFVRARSENFSALVQQQQAVGRLNSALAEGYSAEQQAKEAEGDSFMAEVRGNAGQVQAYASQMDAVRARAQALRTRLMEYEVKVAEWGGKVAKVRNEYRENRAKNREIVARNRQAAAQITADSADAESVAQTARASAIEAFALSAKLRADIAEQSGQNLETDADNAISTLEYVADLGQYRLDAEEHTASFAADRAEYRGKQQINSAVAGTYGQIASTSVRAAQLTQQYRIQLANAYQSLYEAIGRADAARVSGELSRYRGSLGLRTRGSVDSSSQVTRDSSITYDTTNSQSNNCRTEWEPATF